ncbi:hypothetical protein BLL52_4073 [Rhodoferax antarcticus ANT.BR]|uniref:Uncharacterized protein n=1 Tax=Rhodoferax antarcticus ANT.BR TaxID=1111071 RepID=A0A1Q8Y9M4_9BURK|nr:hypothetical protein BLL52_4073 [Rhodoferax antarcticus ANT.BR]
MRYLWPQPLAIPLVSQPALPAVRGTRAKDAWLQARLAQVLKPLST